jgi:hypothetical protein
MDKVLSCSCLPPSFCVSIKQCHVYGVIFLDPPKSRLTKPPIWVLTAWRECDCRQEDESGCDVGADRTSAPVRGTKESPAYTVILGAGGSAGVVPTAGEMLGLPDKAGGIHNGCIQVATALRRRGNLHARNGDHDEAIACKKGESSDRCARVNVSASKTTVMVLKRQYSRTCQL